MHAPVPAEYTAPWIIAGERAIDVPKVRDAIKAIVEGGGEQHHSAVRNS
jgi:hypothetical protein